MTIKYEPVFGDQSLFDNTVFNDTVMIRAVPGSKTKRYSTEEQIQGLTDTDFFNYPPIAMRRVIKTPTWTRADQEAGLLPPVGAEVECGDGNRYEFIGITKHEDQWALRETDGVIFYIHKDSIYPIETPEEKAARLKDEWCKTTSTKCGHMLGLIYDALLSGELKAPTND